MVGVRLSTFSFCLWVIVRQQPIKRRTSLRSVAYTRGACVTNQPGEAGGARVLLRDAIAHREPRYGGKVVLSNMHDLEPGTFHFQYMRIEKSIAKPR